MKKTSKYAQISNKYATKISCIFPIFEHPTYVEMLQKVQINQEKYAKILEFLEVKNFSFYFFDLS